MGIIKLMAPLYLVMPSKADLISLALPFSLTSSLKNVKAPAVAPLIALTDQCHEHHQIQ